MEESFSYSDMESILYKDVIKKQEALMKQLKNNEGWERQERNL